MKWLAALLLLPAPQDDKAAEKLLAEFRQRIETAKSLRAEYAMEVFANGVEVATAKGAVRLKGRERWKCEIDIASKYRPGEQFRLVLASDGRRMATDVLSWRTHHHALTPSENAEFLRQAVGTNLIILTFLAEPARGETSAEPRFKPGGFSLGSVRDGGKEKLGDREARIVAYEVRYAGEGEIGREAMKVKAFIDPASRTVLKRELEFVGVRVTEAWTALVFDEDLPDSEFTFQSMTRVARARTEQVARSVELHVRFTGRMPGSLEDLVRRPSSLDADVFYPACGFAAGIPKDPWGRPFELRAEGAKVVVSCLGKDGKAGGRDDDEDAVVEVAGGNRQAVGAPTDRLIRQFTGRIQLHLLEASVRAFRSAYGELPAKRADLWQKPEWATAWPDGGWLPGAKLPDDPWGETFRMITEPQRVRLKVNDPLKRTLSLQQLTPEERRALEETARPRLSAEENREVARLFGDLGEDDLEARERTVGQLKSFGPSVAALIDERLASEKDPETKGRLAEIRASIRMPKAPWLHELWALQMAVGATGPNPGGRASNERTASATLKTIATAQADFRANDRDGNKIQDFWTGDIAGLYCLYPQGDARREALKLIEPSLAGADAAPLVAGAAGGLHLGVEAFTVPGPMAGYLYRVMTQDNSTSPPESYLQDSRGMGNMGKVHHTAKFGVCAYPSEYPTSGRITFILNEGNTLFKSDTGGEPVLEWPSDGELKDHWAKFD